MRVAAIARKLAVSALSLVVALVAAELIARFAEPGPMSLVDKNPYERPEETLTLPNGSTKTLRINQHKRNFEGRWDGTWYGINSRGWRGAEFEPTFDEREYRVLAVGDSCTFGKGILEADTWPRQLERLLQEALPDRHVMVGNLGVNGYSSLHYRQRISEALDTKPDLVVLGYNVNDFPNITRKVDSVIYHSSKNLRSRIPGSVRESLGTLALYRFLRATYYDLKESRDLQRMERIATRAVEGGGEETARWQSEIEILASMAEEVRATGSELAIFLFPFENMVYLEEYSRGPVDSVREMCKEIDVPFIDMVSEFRAVAREQDPPRKLFLRGDRYHPNPEGYLVVARTVLAAARAQGWLAPSQ